MKYLLTRFGIFLAGGCGPGAPRVSFPEATYCLYLLCNLTISFFSSGLSPYNIGVTTDFGSFKKNISLDFQ